MNVPILEVMGYIDGSVKALAEKPIRKRQFAAAMRNVFGELKQL